MPVRIFQSIWCDQHQNLTKKYPVCVIYGYYLMYSISDPCIASQSKHQLMCLLVMSRENWIEIWIQPHLALPISQLSVKNCSSGYSMCQIYNWIKQILIVCTFSQINQRSPFQMLYFFYIFVDDLQLSTCYRHFIPFSTLILWHCLSTAPYYSLFSEAQ